MADPLSIAGSVTGLVSLGLEVTKSLYRYYESYKHRHDELARTANRLHAVCQNLELLDGIFATRKWMPGEQDILQQVDSCISSSEEIIRHLQKRLVKFQKEPEATLVEKMRVAGRNGTYPFRSSTLAKLAQDVDALQKILSMALQLLQVKDHAVLRDDLGDVKKILKIAHSFDVASHIRQWLKSPDVSVDYNNATQKRHSQTGQWLIKDIAYREWLVRHNSFLWLYGPPGCGKSILLSTAIQHTWRHMQSQSECAIAYFFYTFRDESKQDASALLRAILLQLCHQVTGLEAELTRLASNYPNGPPPTHVLEEYLQSAINRKEHVYLLIDALDEIPQRSRGREVLPTIQRIRDWGLPGLHLLVTSRDVVDIRQSLQTTPAAAINLRNESVKKDISQYISDTTNHDPQLSRWGEHCDTIQEQLSQKADGVFQWVDCQLDVLREAPRTPKHLQRVLNSLPSTLNETYERVLCGINKSWKVEARRALAFLCCSARPLTVPELLDAVAVDEQSERFDPQQRMEDATDLLRICPGLVETYTERRPHTIYSFDPLDILEKNIVEFVRIVHFSVREFLMSDDIRLGSAAEFHLSPALCHQQMGTACLMYLCDPEFVSPNFEHSLSADFPFFAYALEYWHVHVKSSETQTNDIEDRWSLKLLSEKAPFTRWLEICHGNEVPDPKGLEEDRLKACSIYYAAELGLYKLLCQLLQSQSEPNVNQNVGFLGTALQAAAAGGYENVVRRLIDAEANVNSDGGSDGTALTCAARKGHEDVVHILLAEEADVNGGSEISPRALHAAAFRGHENIVRILLERGAEPNSEFLNLNMFNYCRTVLEAASAKGNARIVEMLLNHGAKVNIQGVGFSGALVHASAEGHEDVVRILLAAGSKINGGGGRDSNALKGAAAFGHVNVVSILLEAEVNMRGEIYEVGGGDEEDNDRETVTSDGSDDDSRYESDSYHRKFHSALTAASRFGHFDVVQRLLQERMDLIASDGEGFGKALRLASRRGYQSIVEVLLQARENNDALRVMPMLDPALQAACRGGHAEAVRLLLAAGADVDTRGALEEACERGKREVVKVLFDARPRALTVLRSLRAVMDRVSDLEDRAEPWLRLLEILAKDFVGVPYIIDAQGAFMVGTLLGSVLSREPFRWEPVEMLILANADVNAEQTLEHHHPESGQRPYRTTPLMMACTTVPGDYADRAVNLLLQYGANPNARCDYGMPHENKSGTPLAAVLHEGRDQLAKILLDAGADESAVPEDLMLKYKQEQITQGVTALDLHSTD